MKGQDKGLITMVVPSFMVDADGTALAVFVDGDQGAPAVLVHGSIADHTAFDALVDALAPSLVTFRMDRRGFGASEDGADYAIEYEFGDVAAVVDVVAERTGSPVVLFGHSYGANCALGGAVESDNVSHLVLYEPSFGLRYPVGCVESIEAALARDDRETAIVEVFSTILEMTSAQIDEYRQSPVWPDRVRDAHTVPRECRVEQDTSFESGRWSVGCPALVLTGSDTTDELAAIARQAVAAIDGARLDVLEGQDHLAPRFAADLVAEHLTAFLAR